MKIVEPKKVRSTSVGSPYEKKASNFPMTQISIGSWKKESTREGGMTAKLYFGRRKLIWEFLDGHLKSKMEMQWSDITAIVAVMDPDQPGILKIELGRPPSFFGEATPLPKKHTNWDQASDFTGKQALIHRIHRVTFPPRELDKPLEKLLQYDKHMSELIDKPFPAQDTLFHRRDVVNLEPTLQQPPPDFFNMPYPSPLTLPYYPNPLPMPSYPPPPPSNFLTAAVKVPPRDASNDHHQTAWVSQNNYGWQEAALSHQQTCAYANRPSNIIQNANHAMDPNNLHLYSQAFNDLMMMPTSSDSIGNIQNAHHAMDPTSYVDIHHCIQFHEDPMMMQNGSDHVGNPAAMRQNGSGRIDNLLPYTQSVGNPAVMQNGSGGAGILHRHAQIDNPAMMVQNGSGRADIVPRRRAQSSDNPAAMMQNGSGTIDILPLYARSVDNLAVMLQNGRGGVDNSAVMVQNGGGRAENPTAMVPNGRVRVAQSVNNPALMLQIGNSRADNLHHYAQNENDGVDQVMMAQTASDQVRMVQNASAQAHDDDDDWLLPHINGTLKPR